MTRRRSSACEHALKLLAQGVSVREAARLAGVSPSTVSRALKLDGGRMRNVNPEDLESLLYEASSNTPSPFDHKGKS